MELLNEYLTAMTDTLLGNKGTLDKYEGDAIIAFFGAPMPLENNAQSACDTIRVIGKSLPVKTYELLQKTGCEMESELKTLVVIWEQARRAYLAMDWDKAIGLFNKCLDYEPHRPDRDPGSKTCPSLIYIKRCEAYKKNPPVAPGEVWDGVFTATEK